MNRQLISRLATYHFAPTELNRHALVTEGIPKAVFSSLATPSSTPCTGSSTGRTAMTSGGCVESDIGVSAA